MHSDTISQYFYVDLFSPNSRFDYDVLNRANEDDDRVRIARLFYVVKHGRGDLIDLRFIVGSVCGLKNELIEFAIFCALQQASENPLVAVSYIDLVPHELARIQCVRAIISASRQNMRRAARMMAARNLNAPESKQLFLEPETGDLQPYFRGAESPNFIAGDSPEVRLF